MSKLKKPGLGQVLREICGVDTDKALASSDWRRRPLTRSQLYYSILDVSFLQHIAGALVDLLLAAPAAAPAAGKRAPSGTAPEHAADGADVRHPPRSCDADCEPGGASGAGPAAADVGTPCAAVDRTPGAAAAQAAGVLDAKIGGDGGEERTGDGGGAAADARSADAAEGRDPGGGIADQGAAQEDGGAVQCARLATAWKRSQKLALTLYKPGVSCLGSTRALFIFLGTVVQAIVPLPGCRGPPRQAMLSSAFNTQSRRCVWRARKI